MTTIEEIEDEYVEFIAEAEDRSVAEVWEKLKELKALFKNDDMWLMTLLLLRETYALGDAIENSFDEFDKTLAEVIDTIGTLVKVRGGTINDSKNKKKKRYSTFI